MVVLLSPQAIKAPPGLQATRVILTVDNRVHDVSPVGFFSGGKGCGVGMVGWECSRSVTESEVNVAALAKAVFQPLPWEGTPAPAAIAWRLSAVIKVAV